MRRFVAFQENCPLIGRPTYTKVIHPEPNAMDRTGIVLLASICTLLNGCNTGTKRSEKVLDLREVNDVEVCPLHNLPLQDGVEPIEYAHISHDFQYFDARNRLFPLANTGDITDSAASKALVVFCPECRKAKERWLQKKTKAGTAPSIR
jgi:hypothetical protein